MSKYSLLSDDSSGGVLIGTSGLDGTVKAGSHGRVDFTVIADFPAFSFESTGRAKGSGEWRSGIVVGQGVIIEILLRYQDIGSTEQWNVRLKNQLPEGMQYIPGTAVLTNGNNPGGITVSDVSDIDIGDYASGGAAYLEFEAQILAPPCSQLTHLAAVETRNGSRRADLPIRVSGSQCP